MLTITMKIGNLFIYIQMDRKTEKGSVSISLGKNQQNST
jgi:hypothetical protein